MIKHYLKIACRNLRKNKVFSFINIVGLSIGLTCCLLMVLYIQHELSYDNFQKKGDRITRVIMEYSMGGSVNSGNFTSTKVAPAFKRNFPELESAVRMTKAGMVVRYGDKLFNENSFMYADSTFFDLFSFKLLKGNPTYALSGPDVVILTQSTAKKYFGDENPAAWWAMHQWLQDFAYHINISWWLFLVLGVIAVLVALLTVSFQAIRAAIVNPVKSLRSE